MRDFRLKVDKTLRHYYRQVVCRAREGWWMIRRPVADRPVFVVGCSRAGTTLVYKTLSESLDIGTLQQETHDFWAQLHPLQERNRDTHALGPDVASDHDRDYVTRYFYARTGKRRFVDKNNQNGLCVRYLDALFPDASFVYVKRNPGDNINSLIEGWGRPQEFASWSGELKEKIAIDGGKYTRWCFFLADGWREFINSGIEEVCAFQYSAINRSILEARSAIAGQRWHEVFYEDILQDPVGQFSSMYAACGLKFDSRLERHCKTVLERPYNAFSAIRADKWKDGRNSGRISRVLPEVEEVAKLMGYVI
jgi:hypothetical protein